MTAIVGIQNKAGGSTRNDNGQHEYLAVSKNLVNCLAY